MDTNIVRLERGDDFVRFEFSPDSEWGTMHNSRDEALTLHLDDARARVKTLLDFGWKIISSLNAWDILLQDVFANLAA